MDSNENSIKESVIMEQKKGISGSTLKLVAIFTMLIDHTGAAVLERVLSVRGQDVFTSGNAKAIREYYLQNRLLYGIDTIMRLIGRIAFPIFCFLLVEGMIHTHNKWKYAGRLAVFALISEIPFDLAFNGKPFYLQDQNVFFTLLIGLLVMISFTIVSDKLSEKKWLPVFAVAGAILIGLTAAYYLNPIMKHFIRLTNKNNSGDIGYIVLAAVLSLASLLIYSQKCRKYTMQKASLTFACLAVLAIGMAAAELLKTDYAGFGVLTIIVMYALRSDHFKSMLGGCIALTIMSPGEATSFLNLILIRSYNGKRGMNLKYVFYLFYPVHLTILYLIFYFITR